MKGILGANIRFHGRRYLATGLAVAIAVTFVVISLAFGNAAGASSQKLFAAQYKGAAASVVPKESNDDPNTMQVGSITNPEQIISEVEALPEVGEVGVVINSYSELVYDGAKFNGTVASLMPEGLYQPKYQSGQAPTGANQISLDSRTAKSLKVNVGDSLQIKTVYGTGDYLNVEVVGIYGEDSSSLINMSLNSATMTKPGLVELEQAGLAPEMIAAGQTGQTAVDSLTEGLIVTSADGQTDSSTQQKVVDAINAKLGSNGDVEARTVDQVIEKGMESINVSVAQMNMMLMIFPVIAIIVAIIVISTTFQVIVQQRQRELALLRCLGASSGQVRRLILGESLAVGAIASLIGVAAGALLAAAGVNYIGLASSFGEGLQSIGWMTLVGVFVAGIIITVIAGAKPAFKIARTSPMQALHPSDQDQKRRGVGWWIRLILGAIVAGGSAAGMLVFAGQDGDSAFLLAMLCGVVCLFGTIVLLSAIFPYFATALAAPFRGMLARMAAGNAVRNPGRTSATGVSVVIGVTLIVMMMVGAGSLRTTMNTALDEQMPVDLTVSRENGAITADEAQKISEVSGVVKTAEQKGFLPDAGATYNGEGVSVAEMDPLEAVSRTEIDLGLPNNEQAFVAEGSNFADGQVFDLCLENTCKSLTAVESSSVGTQGTVAVSSQTLKDLGGDPQITMIVGQLEDSGDYSVIQTDITRIDPSLTVSGAGPMRALFDTIINIMLAVVISLLGVSVLVALVGVSNTLSLSVAERTRENGLLRALGMTKRQVSRMLMLEAIFISLSAALVGTGLGIFFGWVGMMALPLGLENVIVAIPWWQIGVVIVVALVAGIVASWLPGRRAARTSPVEALASE